MTQLPVVVYAIEFIGIPKGILNLTMEISDIQSSEKIIMEMTHATCLPCPKDNFEISHCKTANSLSNRTSYIQLTGYGWRRK